MIKHFSLVDLAHGFYSTWWWWFVLKCVSQFSVLLYVVFEKLRHLFGHINRHFSGSAAFMTNKTIKKNYYFIVFMVRISFCNFFFSGSLSIKDKMLRFGVIVCKIIKISNVKWTLALKPSLILNCDFFFDSWLLTYIGLIFAGEWHQSDSRIFQVSSYTRTHIMLDIGFHCGIKHIAKGEKCCTQLKIWSILIKPASAHAISNTVICLSMRARLCLCQGWRWKVFSDL